VQMKDAAAHWDSVFETKGSDEVSWFQAEPATSLRLLERWASPEGSVIDIGAGASTLVDCLLKAGWEDVTLLDVSGAALTKVRDRLGGRADGVTFVAADVRSWQPDRTYDAWHDRAVFHFLVEPADSDRYVAMATQTRRSHLVAWLCSQPSPPMGQPNARACRQLATTPTNLCAPSVRPSP